MRKLSGFTKPSKVNEIPFERAVDDVSQIARNLINALATKAPARNREIEATKARARIARRFA